MKIHPRHVLVNQAKIDLMSVLIEWDARHDLTCKEHAMLLSESLGEFLRVEVKLERAGEKDE